MQDLHLAKFAPRLFPFMVVKVTGCQDKQQDIQTDKNSHGHVEILQFCLLT
jgi:hypothetical protein